MRAMVAVLVLFSASAAFGQEVNFLDRGVPEVFSEGAQAAPKVQDHNILLGVNFLDGFYAHETKVQTSADAAGVKFEAGSARIDLSLGYGYYGLDPLRFRVRGTAGYDVQVMRWGGGTGGTSFERLTSKDKTVPFYKGEDGAFGLGGEVEYRLYDVVAVAGVEWRSARAAGKNDPKGDVDELSYHLINYDLKVGYQVASWFKPYLGLRYSEFEMTFHNEIQTFVFIPPTGPIVPVEDHFDFKLHLKKNLNYLAGLDFGGNGIFSFRIEGWLGQGLYGGTIGMEFGF